MPKKKKKKNILSQREKKLIGFLIIVASLIPFFVITMPAWRDYNQTKKKIVGDKSKTKSIERQIKSLSKLKIENKDLEKDIAARKQFLASSNEIDFLVQDLKALCNDSLVTLESFTPQDSEPINIVLEKKIEDQLLGKAPKTKTSSRFKRRRSRNKYKTENLAVDLYRYPIQVKITGNFTDMLELFKKLEKYGRVISVENVSIAKIQSGRKKGGSDKRFKKSKKTNFDTANGSLYGSFDLVAYSLAKEGKTLPYSVLQRSANNSLKVTKRRKR